MELTALAAVAVLALAGCSSSASSASVVAKPAVTTPTVGAVATVAAPTAPNKPSTLESAEETPTALLLQQMGSGSGSSKSFTPTGSPATARLRVEWKCAPGSAVTNVHLEDGSGDISGPLANGFDGPIPVGHPSAKVVWSVQGSCGWHVRALNQV